MPGILFGYFPNLLNLKSTFITTLEVIVSTLVI